MENPKIEVSPDGRFSFKAMYKIKDKKSLLRLLKQQDLKGLGGILMEDIQESLPLCDKHLKASLFFHPNYVLGQFQQIFSIFHYKTDGFSMSK